MACSCFGKTCNETYFGHQSIDLSEKETPSASTWNISWKTIGD
jgi:hypothetical protein